MTFLNEDRSLAPIGDILNNITPSILTKPIPKFGVGQPVRWRYTYWVLQNTPMVVDPDDELPENVQQIVEQGIGIITDRCFPAAFELELGVKPEWVYQVEDTTEQIPFSEESWFDEHQLEALDVTLPNPLAGSISLRIEQKPSLSKSVNGRVRDTVYPLPLHSIFAGGNTCECCIPKLLRSEHNRTSVDVLAYKPLPQLNNVRTANAIRPAGESP